MHLLTKHIAKIILLIAIFSNAGAQDNNYWAQQYGNVSTLLGGAVTGSYNDNGSLYYNPATLAFADTIKITLSAALYQSNITRVTNATADDTSNNNYYFKRYPITFYPVIKLNSKSRLGFIFIWRINSSYKLHDYRNEFKDITGTGTLNKFIASFDYQNILEESWYGLSYSLTISNRSSLGLALYGTYRYQDLIYRYSADALMNDSNNKYLTTDISHYLNYSLYKGLVKAGYYYAGDGWSAGCAITLPSFYVLSYSRSSSRFYFSGWAPYIANDTLGDLLISDEQRNQKLNFKYPGSISLGFKYKFPKYTIYFTTEIYQSFSAYNLIKLEETANTFPENYRGVSDLILNAQTATRSFANVGAGIQLKLKSNKELIVGFCTDFNSLPKSFDPKGFNISNGRANLFHATAGMDVRIRQVKINGGIKLSYGVSKNQPQLVDMETASVNNRLIGYISNNSNYQFYALNLLLGFNF